MGIFRRKCPVWSCPLTAGSFGSLLSFGMRIFCFLVLFVVSQSVRSIHARQERRPPMSREYSMPTVHPKTEGKSQYQQYAAENRPFRPVYAQIPQQVELLEKLEQTCLTLSRAPTREELVPALRIKLSETFGSLHCALLLLGRAASPVPKRPGFHQKRWKRKKTAGTPVAFDNLHRA